MSTSWIQTYKCRKVDPFNFRREDFDIEDVAHSLANQARYSGHTLVRYSVAEHCVRVLWAVKQLSANISDWRCALLHDSTEAYLLDLPSPIKNHPSFRDAYYSVEKPIHSVIMAYHDLPEELPDLVKEVDSGIVAHEARALFNSVHPDWPINPGRVPPIVGQIGWNPETARDSFLWHYRQLFKGML